MQSKQFPSSSRTRAARRKAAVGVGIGATLALATACGGTTSDASPKSEASAAPQLEKYSKVATPGPELDASSLSGKTVYWIPITSQAPIFSIEQKAAEEAFGAVGIKLQLCDGQANPAAVARCVDQAIAAKAGGIIASSIPPEFAQQSFASAVKANIPLEFVNTKDAAVPSEWGKLAAALPANFNQQAEINNDLIIADSDGKADVLIVGVTDSSVTTDVYEKGMKGYLTENCPDCKVSTVETGTTTISNLASQVSAALVKDPNIEYISVEFDAFAPPVVQALRQVNKANSVKLVTMLGQLDGLQRVADGSAFADTGYSIAALGWNETDVMLRLMLGEDPVVDQHVTPIKTFTKDTVEGLDLSADGWASGAWTSDDDFRSMYRKLWEAS
jgi:ribose transport system substrate-binding protein